MERATGKAERLLQIESLLLAHPDGLSQAEIARRTGVNRSTIHRYLPDLERFCVYESDDGRLAIDRDHYLMNVRLTLHESLALHLAARLMATRTDKRNPHAAAALRKLGLALEKLAPRVAQHLEISAEVMEDQAQRYDPAYVAVLETLTRAWSDGRTVHLWHRLADGRVFEFDFAPYFIEPYAVGRTTHVIGWCANLDAMRTFKLERIQRIQLTDRTYAIPEDFDPREQLSDAWGIWYTDEPPVEIVLKFHPRVAGRVRETQWHHSETVEEQADGSLIWRARVAEPREMVPWIRGWGGDVEVLAPEGVRDQLVGEARRLATLYGIQPIPTYQLLWAKTSADKTQTHCLICHMIDVAQVALAMWNEVLTGSIRTQIAASLDLDEEAAGKVIAFWAGLHDLGKACPRFQRMHPPAVGMLREAGLPFPKQFVKEPFYHGTATTIALQQLLETETGLPSHQARHIARAVGGHHGAWPLSSDIQRLETKTRQVGGKEWDSVRREMFGALFDLLVPPAVTRLGANQQERNTFLTILSGLTSTADWIGSMETYFHYVEVPPDLSRYADRAAMQALRALDELGWTAWRPPADGVSFQTLFDFTPRPMQETVVELAEDLGKPALVIIEAPTGIGKTEAALYLADHWAHTCQQRGLYVAMPTMTTSNQMFSRVRAFTARRYPGTVEPLLIHSQARWSMDVLSLQLKTANELEGDTLAAMSWFLPRKRSLLAPFGVGTVDQALMSVLQTHHFFVRLFGLSHKTVIFDEVHAYDTYMSTLFQRLLAWLQAVGASVVILSATLPAHAREQLLQAYAGAPVELPRVSYPALTWAMGGEIGVVPLDAPEGRSLVLQWIEKDPGKIVEQLADELGDGGCVAIICNTVRRAQEVYLACKSAGIVADDELSLFHARFPIAWRQQVERRVLSRFGKDGDRPHKAIVVATQVIEQSLDLDFDLMVTDLAPVDLVLQRAGRLHRHHRPRPPRLEETRLLIALPGDAENVPDFGRDLYVYEPYVLLRSFLALQGREKVVLPDDTESLIESVYGDIDPGSEKLTPDLATALLDAQKIMQRHKDEHEFIARTRVVPEPRADDLLSQRNRALADDNPEVHQALQALTRLIPPSVSLVCLHQTTGGLSLEPDGSGPNVDLTEAPGPDLTQQLARYAVTITHQGVVPHFLSQLAPLGWRNHPLLRSYRAVIFSNGVCALSGAPYILRLDRELGLEIERSSS